MPKETKRQTPWDSDEDSVEPSDDLTTGTVTSQSTALARGSTRPRKWPVRPSEIRRKKRQMGVTFSDSAIKDRIVALTERWGIVSPDGRRPAYSTVVEYLLLPRLEAAERGEIPPPED
jgi:hypothetical protein